ncbi:MAG: TetR/AcrR family transcriptional regulator [Elusimicrobiales bacterium]
MTNRSVIKTAKRGAILAAARRLMVRRGFGDVQLDEVARGAKIAKGTLFLYFENKDELVLAVFESLYEELGGRLGELCAAGLPPEELLRCTVETVVGHFDSNRDFTAALASGKLTNFKCYGRFAGRISANLDRMTRIIKLCAAGGLVKSRDARYEASLLFGLCRSGTMHRIITGRRLSLKYRVDRIIALFLDGMRNKR